MTQDLVTTNPQSDSALVQMDVFPDFAITLDEARRRIKMLQEFVRDQMVDGEDYGVIPGTGSKPTLLKPGAEKLNAIFGLAPIVEITNRVEDWDSGFVAYEVKVTLLNKRTTNVEAEGVGACNSRERKYKNQDAANIANTILKMAKKRALIDATLSATRASGIFTQDLEDLDLRDGTRSTHPNRGGYDTPRGDYGNGGNYGADKERPVAREVGPGGNNSALTEAQRGAILAMANKAFGRNVNEEMARLVDKPIAQLSKSEASSLIDHLRSLLPERSSETQDRETTFKRANTR